MTTTPIKIIDKPCGSGKTTAMINNFNNQDKYLVIVPLLSEVDRIVEGSKEVEFVQPHANDNNAGTKYASLEEHLIFGRNIVSTHKMYESIVPLAKAGLLSDYHIIIDKVPDVVQAIAKKSKTSIDEFYIDTGFIEVDEGGGLVSPTQKWIESKNEVSDTLSPKILSAAMSGCLYLQDRQMFIWALPEVILKAGLSLTVLTYKAEGSLFVAYLRKLGLSFQLENDASMDNQFREKAAELIAIKDIQALKDEKFSHNAQQQGCKSASYCKKVSGSLKNLRGRKLRDVNAKDILITCMKEAWLKPANDNNVKLGPFAKDSRLGEANWIPNTTRGTNNFAHCSHLIYLYDQHPHPFITRWLGDSSREFADAYALTELIQWVWRSRVRRGQPITLYLPSLRMRMLFEIWLYGN
ncbi:hypothetical protein HIMB100_00009190 [SAR116 cluster alpha proteobacterium HIMB100]|nr:hypothetical protein HIMB100_00009190 [SAR116 cluster alpha proteobacterium HIMB100]